MTNEYKLSYTATQIDQKLGKIDNLATKSEVPSKTSDLTNDSGFITGYTETDPTVPDWAKKQTKPTYTASEVGADASGTASSLISAHNTATDSHSDIREAINNKLNSSELSNAINTALTQAKASGEFDGNSVTVKEVSESTTDAGNNVVTFSDGKTLTVKNGKTGAKGYTPVKGVDYWTDADQETIVQQVIAALGTPVFGRVDVDKNIILTGELADGTYTIKYEDAEGNQTTIGTLKKEVVPEDSVITPVWHTAQKLNSSTGLPATDSANTYAYSDGIPFVDGTEIVISCTDSHSFNCHWYYYDDGDNFVGKTDWMAGDTTNHKEYPETVIPKMAGASVVKLRCNVVTNGSYDRLDRLTVIRRYV